jgi:hypothetical protein
LILSTARSPGVAFFQQNLNPQLAETLPRVAAVSASGARQSAGGSFIGQIRTVAMQKASAVSSKDFEELAREASETERTPSSPCATKKPLTTKSCAASSATSTSPKPGFGGEDKKPSDV